MYYDYECPLCETIEEKMHGMNETPLFFCSKCHSLMKKVISGGAGIHFRGIGWASNNTATNPTAKKYHVKELVGPKFLQKAIRK
jgi:putative FmdB family regulatory protein